MLVLSRLPGERIIIEGAGPVIVTFVEFHGNQIRLGFEAPIDTRIHREEVWHRIQAEMNAVPKPKRQDVELPPT